MSVQYFKDLAAFNVWANSITCTWLEKINDEQWNKEIVSSFRSIYATVLHVVGAEKAWLERVKKELPIFPLVDSFKGSKHELITLWKTVSADLKLFIDSFDENELHTCLEFKRFNGEAFSMPYYQLFAHVINHATYHRGQLVTMLRQVGFTETSSTDLVAFFDKINREHNVEA